MKEGKNNETKTESPKTENYLASVAKWNVSGLLTRIPQVQILSDAFMRLRSSIGRAADS